MPNWCANSIQITGPEDKMSDFYKTLNTPNSKGETVLFSFHQTVPFVEGETKYLSNEDMWGTKWDIKNVHVIKREPTEFLIQGDTAWSPPIRWALRFRVRFPDLQVRLAYVEIGMGFYGVTTITRDKSVSEDYVVKGEDLLEVITDPETKILRPIREGEEVEKLLPAGQLKQFMTQYQIAHMGG